MRGGTGSLLVDEEEIMTPEIAGELMLGFITWVAWSWAICLCWKDAREDETRR
ncbi:unnamed protein product [marine sediment metagenome]|uniref:Uncharacterized protein n=1 Tax=marine sediment metagenome TaxID=412755 RepID=X1IGD9_9ZZZZ